MTDLNERMRGIDRLTAPDMLEEARTRAAHPLGGLPTRLHPVRKLAIISAALAIGLTAVSVIFVAFRPTSAPLSPIGESAGDRVALVTVDASEQTGPTANLSYADMDRAGIPVEIIRQGPTFHDDAPKGMVSDLLGWPSFTADIPALAAIRLDPISIPADVRLQSSSLDLIAIAFAQSEGEAEWNEFTLLDVPTNLRLLDVGRRYRIVLVGRTGDDAVVQFAFEVDIDRPFTSDDLVLLVSSAGPSGDQALLTGTLTNEGGCLAIARGHSSVYVVWPAGYSLAEQDGDTWLLDDSGNAIARIGDEVQVSGGITNLGHADDEVPGGIPQSCEVNGPDAYWFAGTPEAVETTPTETGTEPTRLPGVDAYRVCRVLSLSGDFGGVGDEVVVFEEERVPGAGCVRSEGFQHVAVLREGRVTALSRRITDLAPEAWRVWPYAAPDLDGDGRSEIAVASAESGTAHHVWFFTLSAGGGGIEPIYGPGGPFSHVVGSGPDPIDGSDTGDAGLHCEGERDARRVVIWTASSDDSLAVVESRWRVSEGRIEQVGEPTVRPNDEGTPEVGRETLCGSPVSARDAYPSAATPT